MRAKFGARALVVVLLAILLSMPDCALALEPPTEGMELLARAKTLADNGQMFDPAVVAHFFPGERPVTAMNKMQTGVCQPGLLKDIRSTRWAFSAWFHNLPTGKPHLPYHATGPFGHAGITDDPDGFFVLIDDEFCSDLLHLPDERSALLQLFNLPGFSCLTMQQVLSVMPLTDDRATDGAIIYSYWPPAHREYGTRVTFFFGGSQCLAGFTAEQDRRWGKRYINAEQAFRQCTDIADHKFCAAHPPFGWGDGHTQGLMSESSAKECKGFGLFYREARTPAPRSTSPGMRVPTTPCDGK